VQVFCGARERGKEGKRERGKEGKRERGKEGKRSSFGGSGHEGTRFQKAETRTPAERGRAQGISDLGPEYSFGYPYLKLWKTLFSGVVPVCNQLFDLSGGQVGHLTGRFSTAFSTGVYISASLSRDYGRFIEQDWQK
jgi:hypothetical protein